MEVVNLYFIQTGNLSLKCTSWQIGLKGNFDEFSLVKPVPFKKLGLCFICRYITYSIVFPPETIWYFLCKKGTVEWYSSFAVHEFGLGGIWQHPSLSRHPSSYIPAHYHQSISDISSEVLWLFQFKLNVFEPYSTYSGSPIFIRVSPEILAGEMRG